MNTATCSADVALSLTSAMRGIEQCLNRAFSAPLRFASFPGRSPSLEVRRRLWRAVAEDVVGAGAPSCRVRFPADSCLRAGPLNQRDWNLIIPHVRIFRFVPKFGREFGV